LFGDDSWRWNYLDGLLIVSKSDSMQKYP